MAKTIDWKVALAGGALLGAGIGGFALADAEPSTVDVDDLRLREAPRRADDAADSPLRSPASTTVTVPRRGDLRSSSQGATSTTAAPSMTTAAAPVTAGEDSQPARDAPAPTPPAPPPAPAPPAQPPAPAAAPALGDSTASPTADSPASPATADSPASPATADSVTASD